MNARQGLGSWLFGMIVVFSASIAPASAEAAGGASGGGSSAGASAGSVIQGDIQEFQSQESAQQAQIKALQSERSANPAYAEEKISADRKAIKAESRAIRQFKKVEKSLPRPGSLERLFQGRIEEPAIGGLGGAPVAGRKGAHGLAKGTSDPTINPSRLYGRLPKDLPPGRRVKLSAPGHRMKNGFFAPPDAPIRPSNAAGGAPVPGAQSSASANPSVSAGGQGLLAALRRAEARAEALWAAAKRMMGEKGKPKALKAGKLEEALQAKRSATALWGDALWNAFFSSSSVLSPQALQEAELAGAQTREASLRNVGKALKAEKLAKQLSKGKGSSGQLSVGPGIHPTSLSMSFCRRMLPYAIEVSKATGFPPRFLLSEWGEESNWGRSPEAEYNNNFAGIAVYSNSSAGDHFNSLADFAKGDIQVLDQSRYDSARGFARAHPGDIYGIGQQLHYDGYAADPNYGGNIQADSAYVPLVTALSPRALLAEEAAKRALALAAAARAQALRAQDWAQALEAADKNPDFATLSKVSVLLAGRRALQAEQAKALWARERAQALKDRKAGKLKEARQAEEAAARAKASWVNLRSQSWRAASVKRQAEALGSETPTKQERALLKSSGIPAAKAAAATPPSSAGVNAAAAAPSSPAQVGAELTNSQAEQAKKWSEEIRQAARKKDYKRLSNLSSSLSARARQSGNQAKKIHAQAMALPPGAQQQAAEAKARDLGNWAKLLRAKANRAGILSRREWAHTRATVAWSGRGEPLPALKDLFWAPTSGGNLAVFMRMINEAPVRPGVGVRTPLSPQDGLATIITNFVLRLCNEYLPSATQYGNIRQERWLRSVIHDHLLLLAAPSTGSSSGGHLTRGLDGKLDALLGSTTPPDIAVNQTAITLLTLEQMRENSDPVYRKLYRKTVVGLIRLFTSEFKRELVLCYSPYKPVSQWLYNTAGKLEDPSHLKTTWSQLDALGQSKSKDAPWYRAQAQRIARAYPHVLASWGSQSNTPGL